MYRLLIVVALSLSACSPVQFSAPQIREGSSSVDPTPSPTVTPSYRSVHYNSTVAASNNKLDIVLVIDDSNSMLPDNQKLAANLSGFVTKLQNSNIDWQMCATVTRALPNSSGNWGTSMFWQTSNVASSALGYILKRTSTSDLAATFAHTINYIGAGWAESDDERGIKAAWRHVYNGDLRYTPSSGCYRADSAIAYIIISDEDERSIAGDASQQAYPSEANKPLESEDQPQVFVDYVKEVFGATRRFTVNSIIVKPGDSACKAAQDSGSAKSHYGFKYAELSNLTGGGIGSICEADFSTNLNLFLDRIVDSLSSVPLECVPSGTVNVTITPSIGTVASRVEGMNLVFSTPVPAGRTIDITYQCEETRTPSSLAGETAVPLAQEQGFFARIVTFFKNLF